MRQKERLKRKKIKIVAIAALIFLFTYPFVTGPFIVGPLANNAIARSVSDDLLTRPLPAETEVIDSIYVAGNLISQGNKVQYLGAILIRSERTLEELEEFYISRFTGLTLRVREQASAQIELDTFQNVRLSFRGIEEDEPLENHFILFAFGNHDWSSNFFTFFDIRAH